MKRKDYFLPIAILVLALFIMVAQVASVVLFDCAVFSDEAYKGECDEEEINP